MAKRRERDAGQKAQLNRRDYMRLGGAAVGAAAVGVGATTSVAAQTRTVVDLGEEGLSDGDEIDPYLEEYVDNGVEVRVPEGEYDWDGKGFTGASGDAAIVGQGEVILNNTAGYYYQLIKATRGTIEIRNFTVRGRLTGDGGRFRLQTNSSSKVLVENLNFPDGSKAGAKGKAFHVPPNHAGVVEIRNCYLSSFDDNGIYASPAGADKDGQVIVENCTAHNNNIAGIRVGSTDSIVRNCLVINDEEAPESRRGQRNQRGIRVRRPGKNIRIENCEIIHSFTGTGAPIQLHRGAEGGTGTINNVRILNNTSSTAIYDQDGNTASGWTGTNISITGDGDLGYPSKFDVTTGSSADEPTGDDPQGTDVGGTPEVSAGTDRLRIMHAGPDRTSYEFVATDEIRPLYDIDSYDANRDGDTAVDNDDGTWTATGAVAGTNTTGDTFEFDGYITAFEFGGDRDAVTLYLNGRRILVSDLVDQSDDRDAADSTDDPTDETGDDEQDAADSTDDPTDQSDDEQDADDSNDDPTDETEDSDSDEALSNVLLIDGTATDDLAQYKITVSGRIERSESLSSVADGGSPWDGVEDRVGESTATGIVAKGLDGYRFSGDLVSFQVKGHVDLTIEQPE